MIVAAGHTEGAIRRRAAVEHEAVEVGVGGIAAELAHIGAAWPGVGADLGAFEGAGRMHRQSEPEADHIRTGCYVIAVAVVRIGDPESRRRVV